MISIFRNSISRWLNFLKRSKQVENTPMAPVQNSLKGHKLNPEMIQSVSSILLYNENMLERTRIQWQHGDWESLSTLEKETLHDHPERSKLALFAAAGHLQMGSIIEARLFFCLAQDWGVKKKFLAQILIAGIHNSLGRIYALTGDTDRSSKHFESSILVGTPGAYTRTLVQARHAEQLRQVGLPRNSTVLNNFAKEQATVAHKEMLLTHLVTILLDKLKQQQDRNIKSFYEQTVEHIRACDHIDGSIDDHCNITAKYIESRATLRNQFSSKILQNFDIKLQNWNIRLDFKNYLVKLIQFNKYNIIIEFGSGYSTVVIARELKKMIHRHEDKVNSVIFSSYEHSEMYYRQTIDKLKLFWLDDYVMLTLVSLNNWQAPDKKFYSFYDCESSLALLAQKYSAVDQRLLVIVSNSLDNNGNDACYLAGSLILKYFLGRQIDLLLDNYTGVDENEIVKRWQVDIASAKLTQTTTKQKLAKGACFIRIQALHEEVGK